MEVDQQHITTIRLPPGSKMMLLKDGPLYRLTIISHHDVVHIGLTAQHLQQLYQEVVKTGFAVPLPGHPDSGPSAVAAGTHSIHPGPFDWLAYN